MLTPQASAEGGGRGGVGIVRSKDRRCLPSFRLPYADGDSGGHFEQLQANCTDGCPCQSARGGNRRLRSCSINKYAILASHSRS